MKLKRFFICTFILLGMIFSISVLFLLNIKETSLPIADINDIVKNTQQIKAIKEVLQKDGLWMADYQLIPTLVLVISISFFILFAILLCFYVYINKRIIKPFQRLKGYAQHIASGNFDVPLQMDENHIFGAYSESFDMMREELKIAKENEIAANKSKKELIAGLSHDIKTPVASIRAISELLCATTDDAQVKKKVETIHQKAIQIDGLITDMFHSTLEELGELKVQCSDVYSTVLPKLIKETDYLKQTVMEPVPECILFMDSFRISQVIDNIISNSYKYANTKINISFHMRNEFLEISFQDFGAGVPTQELSLIFNKFYRGSNAMHSKGAGLGLYLAKYLMDQQEGKLICENTEHGFCVKMYIKLS